jgi:3-deoxy-D-manno-octulosonic-acid transferase
MIWRLLYNTFFLPIGWIGFRLYGMFNRKAKRGLHGRKGLFDRLSADVAQLDPNSKRIWFHSASMGEFEQAKPIIAELKRHHPNIDVIVSFFSPSGYEHSKFYKLASVITYIPFDSPRNASRFLDIVRPSAAVMLRYDIWPNHIWALADRRIPTFVASATFRAHTVKNLPIIRGLHRAVYNSIDYILTVSEVDRRAFVQFHLDHPILAVLGDTRYDQVWTSSRQDRHLLAPKVVAGKKVLVIGSSWEEDERSVLPACFELWSQRDDVLVILAPHEPTIENLERIEHELDQSAQSIRFSNMVDYNGERIIVVDSVGILKALYRYAHVAFVGGSFRGGVHNVLEPAVYGIPVLIGPKHQNSQEAVRLVETGGAFVGATADELGHHLRELFEDESKRVCAGKRALELVQQNVGAVNRFLSFVDKVL